MTPIAVLGVEHVDLTVSEMGRSTVFYDTVLGMLGFTRLAHEGYVSWANGLMTIGLRPASSDGATSFDRRRVGLHHLAFKARSRVDVDAFDAFLRREGLPVLDAPAEYPRYGPGYYAVFFADPDGVKLELAHHPWGYWRRVQTDGADTRPRYAASAGRV